jgi:hypothetical protein
VTADKVQTPKGSGQTSSIAREKFALGASAYAWRSAQRSWSVPANAAARRRRLSSTGTHWRPASTMAVAWAAKTGCPRARPRRGERASAGDGFSRKQQPDTGHDEPNHTLGGLDQP